MHVLESPAKQESTGSVSSSNRGSFGVLMASRRVLKSVATNFLSTFVSRNTSFTGYWLFGFVLAELGQVEIDLMHEEIGDQLSPVIRCRTVAQVKFSEQIVRANLQMGRVRQARLVMIKRFTDRVCVRNNTESQAFEIEFIVRIESDFGRSYESRTKIDVAIHDPSLERKS